MLQIMYKMFWQNVRSENDNDYIITKVISLNVRLNVVDSCESLVLYRSFSSFSPVNIPLKIKVVSNVSVDCYEYDSLNDLKIFKFFRQHCECSPAQGPSQERGATVETLLL